MRIDEFFKVKQIKGLKKTIRTQIEKLDVLFAHRLGKKIQIYTKVKSFFLDLVKENFLIVSKRIQNNFCISYKKMK